jgi:hypothetical protein
MYIRITDTTTIYPYTLRQLYLDFKNVSFPKNLTQEVLSNFGVYQVEQTLIEDDYTKNIVELTPTQSGSVYVQTWSITDATTDEINQRIEEKWIDIREERDSLLTSTDWTQSADSPISGSKLVEWQTYRQSLRDITSQSNPYSITWPDKP